jgi:hypothetical protein
MGKFKEEGDPALALAEEMAEAIQVITKALRFGGNWNEIPPGKSNTRWGLLHEEMEDVLFQWERLKQGSIDAMHEALLENEECE